MIPTRSPGRTERAGGDLESGTAIGRDVKELAAPVNRRSATVPRPAPGAGAINLSASGRTTIKASPCGGTAPAGEAPR